MLKLDYIADGVKGGFHSKCSVLLLDGDKVVVDRGISALEKCISQRGDNYYDEYDVKLGVSIFNFTSVNLELDNSSLSLSWVGNCPASCKADRLLHLVRFISDRYLRSVVVSEDEISVEVGSLLNTGESNIDTRIIDDRLFNKIKNYFIYVTGYNVIRRGNKVEFVGTCPSEEMSETSLRYVFMLLYECCLPFECSRVVAIQNSKLSGSIIGKIVSILSLVESVAYIIIGNTDCDTNGLDIEFSKVKVE